MSDESDTAAGDGDADDFELTRAASDEWPDEYFGAPNVPQNAAVAYPPVDIDADRDIRVFVLFPGMLDDDILGELEVYRLNDPDEPTSGVKQTRQPYEALSYAWGTWRISAGYSLPVAKSLCASPSTFGVHFGA